MVVRCINDCGSENFTTDKEYIGTITSEGLQVIDDKGEEHIIAKHHPTGYEHDEWFCSRFYILDKELHVM
ncbi:hypothetical protein ACFFHF_17290 [Robertmurraya beringensis]|uniref:Uncharacterized protein n=1 Tax=Robertmurraya beringensis TaxID=641660 RepID=A0ABV6KUF9_9BACI